MLQMMSSQHFHATLPLALLLFWLPQASIPMQPNSNSTLMRITLIPASVLSLSSKLYFQFSIFA